MLVTLVFVGPFVSGLVDGAKGVSVNVCKRVSVSVHVGVIVHNSVGY